MSERLARVRDRLAQARLDALIVNGAANLRYLTGFTGSNGVAITSAAKQAVFLTDFRYREQAELEIDGAFARRIVAQDLLSEIAAATPAGRVGFDEATTTVAGLHKLKPRSTDGWSLSRAVASSRTFASSRTRPKSNALPAPQRSSTASTSGS